MKAGDSVLVPAYICPAVIDPFQKLGIQILFYPVDQALAPDASAIRELLLKKPRAILIVHYFGFAARAEAVIQECRDHGLWIIEDCAHTLPLPSKGIKGDLGDVTMYSLPKLLPVPDGAVVVVNNDRLPWPQAPAEANRRLVLVNLVWQAANTLETLMGVSLRTRLRESRTSTNMITALRQPSAGNGESRSYHRFRMSPVSQAIHRRIDLGSIAKRRQQNYRWLAAAVKSIKGATPIFGDLDSPSAPLGFPILVDHREAVRSKLMAAGVDPRPIWSALPAQVPIEGFADARYVAAHNIVLPVHQDLTPRALVHIVSALDRALATTN